MYEKISVFLMATEKFRGETSVLVFATKVLLTASPTLSIFHTNSLGNLTCMEEQGKFSI